MTTDSDDALSWEGDDVTEPAPSRDLPGGWNAVGKGSENVSTTQEHGTAEVHGAVDAVQAEEPEGLSTPMLLTLGVIGGVYFLYTVGWVLGGLRLQPLASFLVDDAMFLPWFVLAIVAPALWFLASIVLTRGRAAWVRVAVLLAGAVLLVPWPFVTVGVIGS
ncbi:hypothetical protein AB0O87_09285 [Microbacterium sp. NPDC076768]|uniref:hypothetical protein n=1 Tax=Microbacterium sp. NPDC076768 TaxID=3154858 RepID=UPI00343A1A7C